MSGGITPPDALADARAQLEALKTRRAGMVLDAAEVVTGVRYPDGSGVTFGPVPERLSAVAAVDGEISRLEQLILRLSGVRPQPRTRQVRVIPGKGL